MVSALIPSVVSSQRQRVPLRSDSGPSVSRPKHSTDYGTMSKSRPPSSPGNKATLPEIDEEHRFNGDALSPIAVEGSGNGVGRADSCSESCHSETAEFLDVTWKYMSRMYLLVPLITLVFVIALVLLITFAWPPNKHERKHGQTYPHPFLWKPLFVGLFAGCTVQTIRVPVYVFMSWLNLSMVFTTYSSTIVHSIIHELIRLSTLPLSEPSPTSGFHSTYYLGLGWGIAESVYGIIKGFEQLSLYQDVMRPEEGDEEGFYKSENGDDTVSDSSSFDESRFDALQRADEAELERRVEALERMRARRDLEEVIGAPFPTINLAVHLLWRLDTLLLNLGLTLLLSSFYFDPIPIYKHSVPHVEPTNPARGPNRSPSPYLWSVWAGVAFIHVVVSVTWKLVGRIGVDAVTWGGLIIALGTVFAGLGGWGGLV